MRISESAFSSSSDERDILAQGKIGTIIFQYCDKNSIRAMREAFYHHVMANREIGSVMTAEYLDREWAKFLKDTLAKWNS